MPDNRLSQLINPHQFMSSLTCLAATLKAKYAQKLPAPTNPEQQDLLASIERLYMTHLLINGTHPGTTLILGTSDLKTLRDRLSTSSIAPEEIATLKTEVDHDFRWIKNELNDN